MLFKTPLDRISMLFHVHHTFSKNAIAAYFPQCAQKVSTTNEDAENMIRSWNDVVCNLSMNLFYILIDMTPWPRPAAFTVAIFFVVNVTALYTLKKKISGSRHAWLSSSISIVQL